MEEPGHEDLLRSAVYARNKIRKVHETDANKISVSLHLGGQMYKFNLGNSCDASDSR